MIKFIMERYTSTNNEQDEQDGNKSTKNSKVQDLNESTVALKNLKHTEDQLQALKRRLSVLSIRDEKNENRARENERRMQFHNRVQNQIEKDRRRKMKYLQHLHNQLEQTKSRIQSFNDQRNYNLSQARSGLFSMKKKAYEDIKKQSDSHEKRIYQMKLEEFSNKASRRKQISDMEKLQKQHIVDYFFSKRSSFRDSSAREGSQYETRRSERSKLLEQLAAQQSKMIEKQSSSRAALDQSSRKLYKITSPLRPIKKQKSKSDLAVNEQVPVSTRETSKSPNQQYVFL